MDDDRPSGFGGLLRAYREQALLSQEQLAERSGVTARTIRELEHGRVRRPRQGSVRLLADALALAGQARDEFRVAARGAGGMRPRGTPADAYVPALLPPDVADFTGRLGVVEQLCALLAGSDGAARSTAVVVSAVAGLAGVGKSAVAVHVAHRLRGRFPDGQLYVNLRGTQPEPLDPGEVLGWFLRVLGVDGSAIPGGLQERTGLYRALLAGRRVLVLLDDAGGEAQLRPLLPGSATCAVLVTSRVRLAGLEGARLLDLDVLEPAEAVALLGRIVGPARVAAEPEAAAALARLCGFLPLALRLAGARLAARPHWELTQLVGRLATQRRLDELTDGQREVRASLTLSYEALGSDARRLLRRLGILEAADVTAWVAAALLDSPVDQAAELADRLVDAHLLEVAGRDATRQVRYRFHDLVRLYARERAEAEDPPAEQSAALARALGGWLHLAERADAQLGNPPLLEPVYGLAPRWPVDAAVTERLLADPVAWFEAERAALVAAVAQAAALGMAGVCWELVSALTQFFATCVHLDEWRRCADQALAVARHARDARGEAAVLLSLGTLHEISGHHNEALACWQVALTSFQRLADHTGRAMCLAALALYRSDRAAYQQRRGQAEDALAILSQGGDGSPRARACVLRCLGLLDHNHGRPELARRSFEAALRVHRELGSRRAAAELRYRLGVVCLKQGRDREAAGLLRQALASMRQHGDRLNAALAEVGLGTALVHLGRSGQARPLLEPWAHSGFPILDGWALRALGELDHAQGRHHQAQALLWEALQRFRELDIPAEEAVTERALAASGGDGDGPAHLPDARPARPHAKPRG